MSRRLKVLLLGPQRVKTSWRSRRRRGCRLSERQVDSRHVPHRYDRRADKRLSADTRRVARRKGGEMPIEKFRRENRRVRKRRAERRQRRRRQRRRVKVCRHLGLQRRSPIRGVLAGFSPKCRRDHYRRQSGRVDGRRLIAMVGERRRQLTRRLRHVKRAFSNVHRRRLRVGDFNQRSRLALAQFMRLERLRHAQKNACRSLARSLAFVFRSSRSFRLDGTLERDARERAAARLISLERQTRAPSTRRARLKKMRQQKSMSLFFNCGDRRASKLPPFARACGRRARASGAH